MYTIEVSLYIKNLFYINIYEQKSLIFYHFESENINSFYIYFN